MAPLVTVAIPCYNAEATVRFALESVISQTFQDFEIIVVDDASKDATREVIAGFGDPRLRLIAHASNRGPAAARNTAFDAARGEWICTLDADDALAPDYLESLLRHAAA